MQKEKILLNGMEFIAEPVSFLIPPSVSPEETIVHGLLRENEFFYGGLKPLLYGLQPNSTCLFTLKDLVYETSFSELENCTYFFDSFYSDRECYFNGLKLRLLDYWNTTYDDLLVGPVV